MTDLLYAAPAWETLSSHVILYHGCLDSDRRRIEKQGIDPAQGAVNTDFGRGIYLTTLRRQAEQWAWKRFYEVKQSRRTSRHAPVLLRFRLARVELGALESLLFVRGDFGSEDFWSLVQHCRQSTPDDIRNHNHPDPARRGWYDMVSGPVAAYWQQRVAMQGSDQISFHTPRAAALLNHRNQKGKGPHYRVLPVSDRMRRVKDV